MALGICTFFLNLPAHPKDPFVVPSLVAFAQLFQSWMAGFVVLFQSPLCVACSLTPRAMSRENCIGLSTCPSKNDQALGHPMCPVVQSHRLSCIPAWRENVDPQNSKKIYGKIDWDVLIRSRTHVESIAAAVETQDAPLFSSPHWLCAIGLCYRRLLRSVLISSFKWACGLCLLSDGQNETGREACKIVQQKKVPYSLSIQNWCVLCHLLLPPFQICWHLKLLVPLAHTSYLYNQ